MGGRVNAGNSIVTVCGAVGWSKPTSYTRPTWWGRVEGGNSIVFIRQCSGDYGVERFKCSGLPVGAERDSTVWGDGRGGVLKLCSSLEPVSYMRRADLERGPGGGEHMVTVAAVRGVMRVLVGGGGWAACGR